MPDQTNKKQLNYYNLSEVEKFIEEYNKWWEEVGKNLQPVQTADDSGSNPGGTPPPPPGSKP